MSADKKPRTLHERDRERRDQKMYPSSLSRMRDHTPAQTPAAAKAIRHADEKSKLRAQIVRESKALDQKQLHELNQKLATAHPLPGDLTKEHKLRREELDEKHKGLWEDMKSRHLVERNQ
jgi:hypothetical protein